MCINVHVLTENEILNAKGAKNAKPVQAPGRFAAFAIFAFKSED